MKRIILVFAALLTLSASLEAQDYTTGIGLRGGLATGVTLKHFIGDNSALEGIIVTRWRGLALTGLFELHKMQIFDVERLNFYYGVGGHVGFYDGSYYPNGTAGESFLALGVDGILGVEYNFNEIPINVSVDWKPSLNLLGGFNPGFDEGALSVRYIF